MTKPTPPKPPATSTPRYHFGPDPELVAAIRARRLAEEAEEGRGGRELVRSLVSTDPQEEARAREAAAELARQRRQVELDRIKEQIALEARLRPLLHGVSIDELAEIRLRRLEQERADRGRYRSRGLER